MTRRQRVPGICRMNMEKSLSAKVESGNPDWRNLLDFLDPDSVVTLPTDAGKGEVLAFMVEALAAKGRLSNELVPAVTAALTRRERLGTTGLGHGFALPHLRRREVTEFTGLIGVAAAGIDFGSLDGLPTRVVILVLSPFERRAQHVEILGRLATIFSDKTLQYSVRIPRSPDALLRLLGIKNKGMPCNE